MYQIGTNTVKGNPTACLDGKVENNSEENMLFRNSHFNKLYFSIHNMAVEF